MPLLHDRMACLHHSLHSYFPLFSRYRTFDSTRKSAGNRNPTLQIPLVHYCCVDSNSYCPYYSAIPHRARILTQISLYPVRTIFMSKRFNESDHRRGKDGKFHLKAVPNAPTPVHAVPSHVSPEHPSVTSKRDLDTQFDRFQNLANTSTDDKPYSYIYYAEEGELPSSRKDMKAIQQLGEDRYMNSIVTESFLELRAREAHPTYNPSHIPTYQMRVCGYRITSQFTYPNTTGLNRDMHDTDPNAHSISSTITANGELLGTFHGHAQQVADSLQHTMEEDAKQRTRSHLTLVK